jgi:ATP-binding cassette subfamily F protein 3
MLSISKLKKSYGGQTLFEDCDLQINYGERVALVGPNGAGKTTIFRIILGEEEADRGEVNRDEYTLIGFLPQESEDVGDHTVIEIATGRAGMLQELEVQLKALEVAGTVDVSFPPDY